MAQETVVLFLCLRKDLSPCPHLVPEVPLLQMAREHTALITDLECSGAGRDDNGGMVHLQLTELC